MSVLVTVTIDGDTDKFRTSLTQKETEYRQIGQRARTAGAIHHRFGIGDRQILIVDEWTDQASYEQFFGESSLQQFIKEVGGNPDTAVATVTQAVSSPDQF
jgi:hypothetical protein